MSILREVWQSLIPTSIRDVVYTVRTGHTPRSLLRLASFVSRMLPFRVRCNICGGRATNFRSIWDTETSLREAFERYDIPLSRLEECETLNVNDYMCPWCGANDRDRLYGLFLDQNNRQHFKSCRELLDIAPSPPLRKYIRKITDFNYRSADLFRQDVDDRVDVQNLSCYDDMQFNAVICSHVLEHVPDDRKAISEIYRVLAPDGWAIVMVPILLSQSVTDEDPTITDEAERIRRFDQPDHVRRYSRSDFISRLGESGGTVEVLTASDFPAGAFRSAGIMDRSVLYVLRRPATSTTACRRACQHE